MTNLNSLFLSQAYNDCWDDYNRSLKLRSFPRWDYVILTASNEQQAEGFRKQIADRQNFLPRGTKFIAIPDRVENYLENVFDHGCYSNCILYNFSRIIENYKIKNINKRRLLK